VRPPPGRDNAVVNNPYAPPEHDRGAAASPEAGEGEAGPPALPGGAAGAQAGTAGSAPGAPTVTGPSDGPPTTAPYRSPAGVPYERTAVAGPVPAPRPADAHRLAVLTRATALLVLTAVLAGLLTFPWYLAGAPVALAALVVGGRALAVTARTRQHGRPRGTLALLLLVAVLSLARPATTALTWDAEQAYARCNAGALTVQAQNGCLSDYRQALDARTAQLTHRTP
jgi:hypothetical protein